VVSRPGDGSGLSGRDGPRVEDSGVVGLLF
jgi:hypothetical protein